MSDRRPPPEELDEELEREDDEDEDPLEPDPEEFDVEYFVEVEDVSWVLTSVPKSAHWSQTSSSAPSTLTVLGDAVSVPHISHWTGVLAVMFSPE